MGAIIVLASQGTEAQVAITNSMLYKRNLFCAALTFFLGRFSLIPLLQGHVSTIILFVEQRIAMTTEEESSVSNVDEWFEKWKTTRKRLGPEEAKRALEELERLAQESSN